MSWSGERRRRKKAVLTALFSCLGMLCLMGISAFAFHLSAENKRMSVETDMQERAAREEKEFQGEPGKDAAARTDGQSSSREKEISEADRLSAQVESIIQRMTIEQKVSQLFFVLPDSLSKVSKTLEVGELTCEAFRQYPVGGIVYMENHILSEEQLTAMNRSFRELGQETLGVSPFLAVDEEGGTVTRIAGNQAFPVENVGNMESVGAGRDSDQAYQVGQTLGAYLKSYGFNMDFAPVADVLVNSENTVVKERAFGSDPNLVSSMVEAEVRGLKGEKIEAVLKHFPGHGATAEDSHNGYAYAQRSLEELRETELVPFQAGIDAGAEFVMVGHICFPLIEDGQMPASLSSWAVTELLKGEMGFEGVAVTDAMNMGAIAENYSSAEAAVQAIQAGIDMVLMPADFEAAYNGVLQAVSSQEISQERLHDALRRILTVKLEMQNR